MTCTTCGAAITSADSVCTVCDPWAVRTPDGRKRAKTAGITANLAAANARSAGTSGRKQDTPTPKWLKRALAKQYPPEAIDAGMRRGPIVRGWVMTYYAALAAAFIALSALVNAENYQSLANWHYLGSSPLLLLIGLAIHARATGMKRRVNWFLAYLLHIRDQRPDLGFRWIIRMKQLRVLRVTSLSTVAIFIALIDGNLTARPADLGAVHSLFVRN